MKGSDEESAFKEAAVFFPDTIERVFLSYLEFVERGPDYASADSDGQLVKKTASRDKIFSDHHAACKTALSHMDLLLKLYRNTVPDKKDHPAVDPEILEKAVEDYRNYQDSLGNLEE